MPGILVNHVCDSSISVVLTDATVRPWQAWDLVRGSVEGAMRVNTSVVGVGVLSTSVKEESVLTIHDGMAFSENLFTGAHERNSLDAGDLYHSSVDNLNCVCSPATDVMTDFCVELRCMLCQEDSAHFS